MKNVLSFINYFVETKDFVIKAMGVFMICFISYSIMSFIYGMTDLDIQSTVCGVGATLALGIAVILYTLTLIHETLKNKK